MGGAIWRIALCGVLGLGCGRGFAGPVYSLAHITREEGLPQSSVRAVAVDSRGFIWIGTEKGIARYDGYRFKEPTSPLNSGVVVKLFVDSRDRLWIRWYGKPTTLYDPAQDRWQILETGPSPNSPEYLGETLETGDGRIWYTTNDRLYLFDEATQRLRAMADIAPEPELNYQLLYAQRTALFQGSVWIAGFHQVVRVAGDAGEVTRIPVTAAGIVRLWVREDALWMCNAEGVFRLRSADRQWEAFHPAPHPAMTSCLFDAQGALWMGFASAGAVRVDPGRARHFRPRAATAGVDHTSLADDYVINVQQDGRGQTWVMTPGIAHRWTGEGFERFEFSPDSQAENPGGVATVGFAEDPNGVLWFGSEDHGLARLSPFARKVQWFVPPSQRNAHVRASLVDRRGDVWLGMNQDGVYRWNSASASWSHYSARADNADSLPTMETRALYATRAGDIWAGSQRGGIISRYDPASDSWRRYELGVPGLVFNFLELPDGQLLIGREGGVTQFDTRTRRTQHFEAPGNPPIRAALLSRTGRVFLGTHQNGVMEWTPERGVERAWSETLSDRNVFALYEDRVGALWIGTWGGGLNRLSPDSGDVQVISTDEGLPDSTVFGILPGKHDDIWVSTNNGLARIENCLVSAWPCQPKIAVLDTRSGLPFAEFDAEAHAQAPNGDLLFGGYQGLIRFDPDSLEVNRRLPRLQVSEIFFNDRALPAPQIPAGDALLELPHGFGALKIQFSALDLNQPANVRYQYRLSSREWLSLGATPELVLSDLAPGDHVLELLGTNSDGLWSEQPLMLSFRVAPPWYSGTAARLSYLALLLLVVVQLVKWRERRLRAAAAYLESTVAERTRQLADATQARDEFYANVSHEIRTPLALLTSTAEQLKENRDSQRQAALTSDLVRHSDRLRRYVESLITVSHLQSSPTIAWLREDVGPLLRSLVGDFERISGNKQILLEIRGDDGFVRSYPNALDTIFANLLVNAIRHTPERGTIQVVVEARPDTVVVTMCDSGPGIEPQLLATLFDRGARGEGVARTTSGYGIGLNLVKQTVLALGGAITARNGLEGGACFAVSLRRADPGLPIAAYPRLSLPEDAPPNYPARRAAPVPRKARGSVLIVEDHEELRGHLLELLASDYRVRAAGTVRDGLADARKYLPDIVICDVMLPDGEGFGVVSALKTDAITDHISTILLTALADDASRLRGLTHQADLYVTKPFSREMLLLQVANLMNQRRRLRRAAAREAWAAKASSQKPKEETFEARLLVALEDFHANPDCDVDLLAKHLAMSRKQLERKTRYCFKCSPKLLLNRYRLDRAQALLNEGSRVGEVAQRCGFSSQTHFGVLFKKRFGYPPSRMTQSRESPSRTGQGSAD